MSNFEPKVLSWTVIAETEHFAEVKVSEETMTIQHAEYLLLAGLRAIQSTDNNPYLWIMEKVK